MQSGFEIYDDQGRLVQSDRFFVGTQLDKGTYPVRGGIVGLTGGFLRPPVEGINFVNASSPFYVNPTVCPEGATLQDDEGIRIYGLTNQTPVPSNINVWTYGLPPIDEPSFGLECFNEKGERYFNSQNPYMQVVGIYQMKVNDPFGGNVTEIQTEFAGSNYAVCLTSADVYTNVRWSSAAGVYIESDMQMFVYLDTAGKLHAQAKLIFEVDSFDGVAPAHRGSGGTVLIADISSL